MKAATIRELKEELNNETPAKLAELCLRLARYKKENKELLTYLLFEANDTDAYITGVMEDLEKDFANTNLNNVFIVKKTLRKILRNTNKYIRYSGSEIVETELLIYCCISVKKWGIAINKNTVINNIYHSQLKKIQKAIASMHEDMQFDYLKRFQMLNEL